MKVVKYIFTQHCRVLLSTVTVVNCILIQYCPCLLYTSTIPLNNNKTINVKRSHLPLVCACATTIHKSQGSTYPEIVYEYDKKHPLSLVYVALTRVTSLQGLYITTKVNDRAFYHGRRASTAVVSLQDEFRKLSLNRLEIISSCLLYTSRCV